MKHVDHSTESSDAVPQFLDDRLDPSVPPSRIQHGGVRAFL